LAIDTLFHCIFPSQLELSQVGDVILILAASSKVFLTFMNFQSLILVIKPGLMSQLFNINLFTSKLLKLGLIIHTIEASPTICGVAIDVHDFSPYILLLHEEYGSL